MKRHSPVRHRGFTLIELLVVVAIIALLISILLPSLGAAKRLAKTVKCAAQIKGITLAQQIYASEWNNAIVGNAHTSGNFLMYNASPAYSDDYCPNVSQIWDWTAPVAKVMNLTFDEAGYAADRRARYQTLSNAKAFVCPENEILATSYTGSGATFQVPVTKMISYVAATPFQYEWGTSLPSGTASGVSTLCWSVSYTDLKFPGYHPKVNLVGNPSNKVFIADGAKYSLGTTSPDMNLAYLGGGSPGGAYCDWGPYDSNSRSYQKPNGMSYAMRHGSRVANGSMSVYKFNLGFFDGHAETMNGLDGSNPALWTPTGSIISPAEADATKTDVISKYFSTGTITVP